ncbi:UBA domain-containing protein [Streptomyces puniciscabiei]
MPEDCENTPETDNYTSDETGLDPKDIELVMAQTGASRAVAVKALKASGGDLINAITAASE